VSRLRSSITLLGICVVALVIGGLRLLTERTPLPVGSSYSAQPDGALGVYAWFDALGGRTLRLRDLVLDESQPASLVVVQPESPLDQSAHDAFDGVAQRGGTLVVAGDSLPWLLYTRSLGVTVEPLRASGSTVRTQDGLAFPLVAHYRLAAAASQPVLLTEDGQVVALRTAYKGGSLLVIASPEPLTNLALSRGPAARFVYREILSPSVGQVLTFDEVHHSFSPAAAGTPSVNQLLFDTPPGRAILYAALLTFAFLALRGRRLGPPLPARPPTETRRTMYEHVQMLASLYRRAGQLGAARDAFSRHYARLRTRSDSSLALRRIETARTESDLIAAVAAFDDAS
jgi:hypothetical protein